MNGEQLTLHFGPRTAPAHGRKPCAGYMGLGTARCVLCGQRHRRVVHAKPKSKRARWDYPTPQRRRLF